MEELEKDLEQLEFSKPPQWAKARSLMAAENVLRQQARRSRMRCLAVAFVAAGISIVAVGTYIADAIAPIMGKGGPQMSFPQNEAVHSLGDYPRMLPAPRPTTVTPSAEKPASTVPDKEKDEEKEDEKENGENHKPQGDAVKNESDTGG